MERQPCLWLCLGLRFGNDGRGMTRCRDVSLSLHITFCERKQKLCVFHSPLHPLQKTTRLEVDNSEAASNRFDRIQCRRDKESSSRAKRKRKAYFPKKFQGAFWNQILKHQPEAGEGERRRSKRDVRGRAAAGGTMKKRVGVQGS